MIKLVNKQSTSSNRKFLSFLSQKKVHTSYEASECKFFKTLQIFMLQFFSIESFKKAASLLLLTIYNNFLTAYIGA